jgi:hypothetical protein
MEINNVEMTKQVLVDLNNDIGVMEQRQGKEAHEFFNALLSDQLIFRRASGKVVGKSEPEGGFLASLNNPSPFTLRQSEDIHVSLIGNRALVTLIVVGTKADSSSNRYRNVRLFSRSGDAWILECWYNYEITSL